MKNYFIVEIGVLKNERQQMNEDLSKVFSDENRAMRYFGEYKFIKEFDEIEYKKLTCILSGMASSIYADSKKK